MSPDPPVPIRGSLDWFENTSNSDETGGGGPLEGERGHPVRHLRHPAGNFDHPAPSGSAVLTEDGMPVEVGRPQSVAVKKGRPTPGSVFG